MHYILRELQQEPANIFCMMKVFLFCNSTQSRYVQKNSLITQNYVDSVPKNVSNLDAEKQTVVHSIKSDKLMQRNVDFSNTYIGDNTKLK